MIERLKLRLISSLQLACVEYEMQKEYFEEFVYVPEGVFSAIDDALKYVPELRKNKLLTDQVCDQIEELEDLMNRLWVDIETLDLKDLLQSVNWQGLKWYAQTILEMMGEEKRLPNKKWI